MLQPLYQSVWLDILNARCLYAWYLAFAYDKPKLLERLRLVLKHRVMPLELP
jgi:hypothetical protein